MALDHRGADDSGLVGRIIAGNLRVTQRTGSTPQGRLYEAEDPEGRGVVLLILPAAPPGQEPAGLRSFRFATQIRHPNVAAVLAVGSLEDRSAYVVLEEATGEPLLHLLSARPTLPIGEALELTVQVASGLEAVHRAGFVHGTVSPSTILVTRPPFGKLQVKLVGFSLDADPELARKLDAGSAPYASPERLAGSSPDARCDVFSVGAVLHHLLTGGPPAPGRPVGKVPKIARPVLERALARLPAARFRTMSELREALEALAVAAVTPPETLAYRRILSRAIMAGLVLVTSGVLLAPVWRNVEKTWSRAPALAPPPAPTPSASPTDTVPAPTATEGRRGTRRTSDRRRVDVPAEPRRSTEAGRIPAEPRAQTPTPTQKPVEPSEALGYMGPGGSSDLPPDSVEPKTPPRPLAVLEQHPALRLAIGDITRVGLAEKVAEVQGGVMVVQLAPGGMDVPSATYNLQRLYLAYSAATDQPDTVALVLRRNGELYGWFTREGLRYARPDGTRR